MRSFFGGGGADEAFDDRGSFVPAHIPEPGPFLDDAEVLTGDDHVAVHETARECFEERGVYDVTFGYNLARLNLDQRHPDAGFRYGVDGDDLRAEFTPTTEFCPQSDTLTVGAFRAWNGLEERHDYDLVRVRVAPSHQRADAVNDRLAALEDAYVETGELPDAETPDPNGGAGDDSLPF
ncbi:hypothetical protein EFA46_013585 (plasmid) [Halarchaeum sp. CBA1220]|uniref:hypothetical protein n=1 Tax=Halarchaeum sp. CBA1220 TaxID=1853682 RepID=UPI000F3AA1F7|nr:hypothetical protein [Halarchaeum sp. CBA1220]QLC35294.1 hypothetical protein EFA46_013585 [Halarchaeum sp. CBA1220]